MMQTKREIKFRFWNSHTKEMKYDPLLWASSRGGIDELNTSLNRMQSNPNNSLMQFTGLTDKNGKEIYEGDIVKTGTDKLMVITWNKRFASFCIEREGWAFSHWFGEAFESTDCEVVGNIYENPELLHEPAIH